MDAVVKARAEFLQEQEDLTWGEAVRRAELDFGVGPSASDAAVAAEKARLAGESVMPSEFEALARLRAAGSGRPLADAMSQLATEQPELYAAHCAGMGFEG